MIHVSDGVQALQDIEVCVRLLGWTIILRSKGIRICRASCWREG